ncbi:MAG TPA: threonine synthase, partial [Rhodocyclaceae bacterium]|nr:threonine synthase [Rhodocyclaceae bacterium]
AKERRGTVPMIVLETAQAVKFAETIREALNLEAPRPAELNGIENLPQRVEVMNPDTDAVKAFVKAHC